MRVAILSLNRGRGSGVVARQHARAVLRRGHEVVFLHPRIGAGVAGAENREVPLHSAILPVHEYLPGYAGPQRQVATMSAGEAFAYLHDYEIALEGVVAGADLVIGHHANITAAAVRRVAARAGVPFVVFVHGTGIEPLHRGGYAPAVWTAIERALRAADGIIVTTEYVRDTLVRPVVDLPIDRFLVLPCGVDVAAFGRGPTEEMRRRYELPARYVICPGAVTWLKGAHNVVAAAQTYADQAPTLFIGDGDLRSELEHRLGDRGRFLGYVPAAHKTALIGGAAVLVAAPEKREHFGLIYVEGLAGGAVPVAYRGGGVDSIVTPEVGVLTERSPDALGSAVRHLLAAPERRRELARRGRIRAEAHFSEVLLGDRLVDWLEQVALRGSGYRGPDGAAAV